MPKLLGATVVPYYAQVQLLDPDQPNAGPEFETGAEAVVATESTLAVATRPDYVSGKILPISVEVWKDDDPPGTAEMIIAWTGLVQVGPLGVQVEAL